MTKTKTKVKKKAPAAVATERTKIFAYKGYVGIQSGPKVQGLIAKPGNGNIGVTVDAASTDVSQEAIDLLKQVKKVSGSFGDIMIFKTNGGPICIAWLGSYLNAFKPADVEGDRDYNPSLLVAATEPIEIPEEFKAMIDGL
jgi:hypothetical protein